MFLRLFQRKRFGAIYAILSIAEIEVPDFPVECVSTTSSSDFSRFIANRLRPWGPESWRVLSPVPRLGKHFRQSNWRNSMKSLFVGNMNFKTTESDLRALFAPFGQITRVHMAVDRETGRARGFAFVEMPKDMQAAKRTARRDGKRASGRQIE